MKTYLSRLAAAGDLNTRVPALQVEAQRLADAAAKAAAVGQTPVSAYGTLDQLLSAILECQAYRTPGMVSPQKAALSTAAGEVVAVRHEAMMLLRTTSDRDIGRQIAELSNEVSSLESAIRSRGSSCTSTGQSPMRIEVTQYAGDAREFYGEPAETRRVCRRAFLERASPASRNSALWRHNDPQRGCERGRPGPHRRIAGPD